MSQLLFLWFHAKLEDYKVLKGLRTFHHSYKVAFYLIYIIKNCNRDIQILWNQIDPCHSHCFSDSRNIMLLGSQTIINLRVFQDICQSSIWIQLFHVIDIIIKFQKFTTSHGTFVWNFEMNKDSVFKKWKYE